MIHRAGELNIRVNVQRKDAGTSASGDETGEWYTLGEAWVGLMAESGSESTRADRIVSETGLAVKMRKYPGLKSGDRLQLKSDGRILYLVEPPRDPDGRNEDWVVRVSEVEPSE